MGCEGVQRHVRLLEEGQQQGTGELRTSWPLRKGSAPASA